MEVEYVRIDFQWNSSIRYLSSWSTLKKRKTQENDLRLRNHTTSEFVGSLPEFVGFGFCCLGLPPKFAHIVHRQLHCMGLLVHEFATWVCQFMGSLLGSPTRFVVSVFSVQSTGFVVSLVFMDFFSEGEAEEEGTEVCWVSFVEIECLVLKFHMNFNRN